VSLENVSKKLLRQILRRLGTVSLATDVRTDRVPVGLTQAGKGLPGFRRGEVFGRKNATPAGGWELPGRGRCRFGRCRIHVRLTTLRARNFKPGLIRPRQSTFYSGINIGQDSQRALGLDVPTKTPVCQCGTIIRNAASEKSV